MVSLIFQRLLYYQLEIEKLSKCQQKKKEKFSNFKLVTENLFVIVVVVFFMVRTLLGVDWKIPSIRKEPMLSVFFSL